MSDYLLEKWQLKASRMHYTKGKVSKYINFHLYIYYLYSFYKLRNIFMRTLDNGWSAQKFRLNFIFLFFHELEHFYYCNIFKPQLLLWIFILKLQYVKSVVANLRKARGPTKITKILILKTGGNYHAAYIRIVRHK